MTAQPRRIPSTAPAQTSDRLLRRAADLLDEAERLSASVAADRYLSGEQAALRMARVQAAASLAQAYTALATATDPARAGKTLPASRNVAGW